MLSTDVDSLEEEQQDIYEIVELYSNIQQAADTALQNAVRIGELLVKWRKKIAHGQWLPWLKERVVLSERQARRCMALYRKSVVGTADLKLEWKKINYIDPEAKAKRAQKKAERDLLIIEKLGLNGKSVEERIDIVWDYVTRNDNEKAKHTIAKVLVSWLFDIYPDLKDEPF